MKYSFPPQELNNLKGAIAESLVWRYIDGVLIPKLEKDFDLVFMKFVSAVPFSLPLSFVDVALLKEERINWEKAWKEEIAELKVYNELGEEIQLTREQLKLHKEEWKNDHIKNATIHIPRKILEMFLEKGVYPNPDLFDKTLGLLLLMEVATDGILFKLNKVEKFRNIKAHSGGWSTISPSSKIFEELDLPKKISVVSGEIEIIEIKADKSYLHFTQRESYKSAVRKGYPLRYFHVYFISFESNHFEIQERLILKAEELDTLYSATKKS